MNRNEIIANNIKTLLKENNMTQAELATKIGMSKSTITEYLKGRVTPSNKAIEKISKLFSVNKNEIDSTYDTFTIHNKMLLQILTEKETLSLKLKKNEKPIHYLFTSKTSGEAMDYLRKLEKIKTENIKDYEITFEHNFYYAKHVFLNKTDFNNIILNEPLNVIIDIANKTYEYIDLLIDVTFYEDMQSAFDQKYNEFLFQLYNTNLQLINVISPSDKIFIETNKTDELRKIYAEHEKNSTKKSTD